MSLVLSRSANVGRNVINIGEAVVVTIDRVRGGRVSVRIDAPPDVAIVRGELPATPADVPIDQVDEPAPAA